MILIFQILFFFFTWFTNLNATSIFVKVVLPTYELTFSKIENVRANNVVKVRKQNFAKCGVGNNKKIGEWKTITFCTDKTCAYNQGRLVFDVLSLVYGGGELKAVFTAGITTTKIIKYLTTVDKTFVNLVRVFKKGGHELTKVGVTYYLKAKKASNALFTIGTIDVAKKAIRFSVPLSTSSTGVKIANKLENITYVVTENAQDVVKHGDVELFEESGVVKVMMKDAIKKSKFGQSLDEIGEVLENGLVKGKYSERTFDPDKVGEKILSLTYSNVNITKNGISDIKTHLNRLDPSDWNIDMVKRIEDIESGKIQITDFDKRFYTHELRELERSRKIGLSDSHKISYEEWNDLHSATLEDYKLHELIVYQGKKIRSLYHPSVQK